MDYIHVQDNSNLSMYQEGKNQQDQLSNNIYSNSTINT